MYISFSSHTHIYTVASYIVHVATIQSAVGSNTTILAHRIFNR